MKFIDLLECIDCEQQMTVCILAGNGTDVEDKIIGDQASICKMISEKFHGADVDSIAARNDRNIWVWLKEDDE